MDRRADFRALHDELVGCRLCPRLVAWREKIAAEKRAAFRDDDYWGRPVPGFGDPEASVLVVGLDPPRQGQSQGADVHRRRPAATLYGGCKGRLREQG